MEDSEKLDIEIKNIQARIEEIRKIKKGFNLEGETQEDDEYYIDYEYDYEYDTEEYDADDDISMTLEQIKRLDEEDDDLKAKLLQYERILYTNDYVESRKKGTPIYEGETDKDHLSRSDFAKVLAEYIVSKKTVTPLNIGVYGDWGVGKSSFLKLIEKEIQVTQNNVDKDRVYEIHTIKYNASEYSEKNKIWASILKKMFAEYEREHKFTGSLRFSFYRWKKKFFNNVLGYLTNLILIIIVFAWALWVEKDSNDLENLKSLFKYISTGLIPISLVLVNVIIPFIKSQVAISKSLSEKLMTQTKLPDYISELGEKETFVEDLYDLLDVWIKKNKSIKKQSRTGEQEKYNDYNDRIVLYIDDMDRCSEKGVMELLEALQLFIEIKPLIVILSINSESVINAIKIKYVNIEKKREINERIYLKYLEKYINVPFYLHHPGDYSNLIENSLVWERDNTEMNIKNLKDMISSKKKVRIANDIIKKSNSEIAITNDTQVQDAVFLDFNDQEKLRLEDILNDIHIKQHLTPRDIKKSINIIIIAKEVWKIVNRKNAEKVDFYNYIPFYLLATYDYDRYKQLIDALMYIENKNEHYDDSLGSILKFVDETHKVEFYEKISKSVVEFDKYLYKIKLYEIEVYKIIIRNFIYENK